MIFKLLSELYRNMMLSAKTGKEVYMIVPGEHALDMLDIASTHDCVSSLDGNTLRIKYENRRGVHADTAAELPI